MIGIGIVHCGKNGNLAMSLSNSSGDVVKTITCENKRRFNALDKDQPRSIQFRMISECLILTLTILIRTRTLEPFILRRTIVTV